MTFKVEVTVDQVTPFLRELAKRGENLAPVMPLIGQSLVDATKLRFDLSQAPDGSTWKPLALSTILARARTRGGSKRVTLPNGKTFKGRKPGGAPDFSAKPLLDTGVRRNDVHFTAGALDVTVGSSFKWMAAHQYGNARIPKREWLGVSTGDRAEIMGYLRDHFQGAEP